MVAEEQESDKPGPKDAAKVIINTPEKICIVVDSPVSPPSTSEVEGVLTYRVHYRAVQPLPFHDTGQIPWCKPTLVVLPNGFNWFRVSVDFATGDSRSFSNSETYGPLRVEIDPDSRTLTLQPEGEANECEGTL
jgi:hypothetical protein